MARLPDCGTGIIEQALATIVEPIERTDGHFDANQQFVLCEPPRRALGSFDHAALDVLSAAQ